MADDKKREFWLDETTEWWHSLKPGGLAGPPHQHTFIHVIEYSAYSELREELNKKLDWIKVQDEIIRNEKNNVEALTDVARKLKSKTAKLKAQNWVLKDNNLRTYDGMAQKADAYDDAIKEIERLKERIIAKQMASNNQKSGGIVKFNLIGDINEESYKELAEYLEQNSDETIDIEITSHGGDALIAIAMYDKIKNHKRMVTTTAIGIVASAATLVLAAGFKKRMTKNSWVMVHEDTVMVGEDDRVAQAEKQVKIARLLEDQWNRLLADNTRLSANEWSRLHKRESYLTAEDCKKYGLVDEII